MFDKDRRVVDGRYICNCTHPGYSKHWRFMHSQNWKHTCLNRELKWDYVYQVFMAKSTFLCPFLNFRFGVLYKMSRSGFLYVIKFYLGIFRVLAHTLSMEISVVRVFCVRASLLLLVLRVALVKTNVLRCCKHCCVSHVFSLTSAGEVFLIGYPLNFAGACFPLLEEMTMSQGHLIPVLYVFLLTEISQGKLSHIWYFVIFIYFLHSASSPADKCGILVYFIWLIV